MSETVKVQRLGANESELAQETLHLLKASESRANAWQPPTIDWQCIDAAHPELQIRSVSLLGETEKLNTPFC